LNWVAAGQLATMHSLQQLIFLSALLANIVLGSPTPQLQKRSFTHVVRRRLPGNGPTAGLNAIQQAYRKYGFDLPSDMVGASDKAVAGAQIGSVAANPEPNAAEYLSPVSIGGQTLNLDFDTGSSDL
jgi:hypothetical protein